VAMAQQVTDRVPILAALIVPGDATALDILPTGEFARNRTIVEIDVEKDPAQVRGNLEFGEIARALPQRELAAEFAAIEINETGIGPCGVTHPTQQDVLSAQIVVDVSAVVHAPDRAGRKTQERDVFGGVGILPQQARHLGVEIGALLHETRDEAALDEPRARPTLETRHRLRGARAMRAQMHAKTVRANGLAANAAIVKRQEKWRSLEGFHAETRTRRVGRI